MSNRNDTGLTLEHRTWICDANVGDMLPLAWEEAGDDVIDGIDARLRDLGLRLRAHWLGLRVVEYRPGDET